jgi:hypothetical protein
LYAPAVGNLRRITTISNARGAHSQLIRFVDTASNIAVTGDLMPAASWTDEWRQSFPLLRTLFRGKPTTKLRDIEMAKRDYESTPVSEALGIRDIITGLASDLDQLRAGKISVNDAMARSMLAKQIFNGMRIYLNGVKLLSESAKPIGIEGEDTPA